MPNLIKVISGGQTGVDRAGLDAALSLGIPIGGWCPKGRRAADGRVPTKYALTETPASSYLQRTELNVFDADATIIMSRLSDDSAGIKYTKQFCRKWKTLIVDFTKLYSPMFGIEDIVEHLWFCRVINVAGNREEIDPGVHDWAFRFLMTIFERIRKGNKK
jgi:hypothetical protein